MTVHQWIPCIESHKKVNSLYWRCDACGMEMEMDELGKIFSECQPKGHGEGAYIYRPMDWRPIFDFSGIRQPAPYIWFIYWLFTWDRDSKGKLHIHVDFMPD